MKCGLIWARSARSSASIARFRERSSSASSTCEETHSATSSAARTRPAVASGPYAISVPTTRSSPVTGTTTAERMSHSLSSQATRRASRTIGRPVRSTSAACAIAAVECCRPAPSQASTVVPSVSATAVVPSSVRRCLAARLAPAGVRPSRRCGAASEAVCKVAKVARSLGPPSSRRCRTKPTDRAARATTTSVTRARAVQGPIPPLPPTRAR